MAAVTIAQGGALPKTALPPRQAVICAVPQKTSGQLRLAERVNAATTSPIIHALKERLLSARTTKKQRAGDATDCFPFKLGRYRVTVMRQGGGVALPCVTTLDSTAILA